MQQGTGVQLAKIYDKGDSEEVIADKRYKYIAEVVKQTVVKASKAAAGKAEETVSDKIDKILTNRFLALPAMPEAKIQWPKVFLLPRKMVRRFRHL